MRRRLIHDERGSVLIVFAVAVPLLIGFCAIALDIGNWYSHKRSLQARVDAGALAAGVQYRSDLIACKTDPGTTGATIATVAQTYAGYTKVTDATSDVLSINSSSYAGADGSDGGNACFKHTANASDYVNPNGGYWTDVKARETGITSLFGGFFSSFSPAITARARVDVRRADTLVAKGLPFVGESGDAVPCAWARFYNARNNAVLATTLLAADPDPNKPRQWNGTLASLTLPSNSGNPNDVAVRVFLGSAFGGPCPSAPTTNSAKIPDNSVGGLDWINVYDDSNVNATGTPQIGSVSVSGCSTGPGFVSDPTPCTLTVNATAFFGGTQATQGSSVYVTDTETGTEVLMTTSNGTSWTASFTVDPNQQGPQTNPPTTQRYSRVGQHGFTFRWQRNLGLVGGQNCSTNLCTGSFDSGLIQNASYFADPLHSVPLVKVELRDGSGSLLPNTLQKNFTPSPVRIHIESFGLDTQHSVLIRDSVQASGNRTGAAKCWSGNGGGTSDLEAAIKNGCPLDFTINNRLSQVDPCDPEPVTGVLYDCLSDKASTGNRTAINKALDDRFGCTPVNWPNFQPNDPRLAYVYMTTYGMLEGNGNFPISGFAAFYVTGFDSKDGCNYNEDPPRGYDSNGTQVWGHFVNFVDLSTNTEPGPDACDLNLSVILCKPSLVR